jgi:hypothetical protein
MKTYTVTRSITDTQTQVLSFVKDGGIWYADLPEFLEAGLGSRANLMMVDGADTFLDLLAEGDTRITLKISSKPFQGWQTKMQKIKVGHNSTLLQLLGHAPVDYGAYYKVTQMKGEAYDHQLWLCPVTEYVFGNYPQEIYTSIV